MMTAARALVWKELRALAPIWGVSLMGIVALGLGMRGATAMPAVLTSLLGALVLGAHAAGHEHTSRTLGVMLVQPVPRGLMLAAKSAVLGVLVTGLAAIAAATVEGSRNAVMAIAVVACGAFFVTPWLTLATRSAMAGVVFTVSLGAALALGGEAAAFMVYDRTQAAESDAMTLSVFLWGAAAACVAGAILGPRAFLRLEWIDGAGRDIQLPFAASRARRRRTRGALAHLVAKELRLQQMTFVAAALLVLLWGAMWMVERSGREAVPGAAAMVALLVGTALAALAGLIASAEERHLGTHELQLLLPWSAAAQWRVKVAVVLTLALLVGAALPALLVWIASFSPVGSERFVAGMLKASRLRQFAAGVLLVAALALYVSSFSRSGLRAVAAAVPVVAGASVLMRWTLQLQEALVPDALLRGVASMLEPLRALPPNLVAELAVYSACALLMGVLIMCAGANHRVADRGAARLARQGAALAAVAIVGQFLLSIPSLLFYVR